MSADGASVARRYTGSTVAILALSVVSSLLGLFRDGHYDVDPALLPRYQAQDAVVLVVAVPVLAIALRSARRGSRRGRVVWLGTLAYLSYLWASIAAQAPFAEFFLGYVALFALSLFTLVGAVVHTDPEWLGRGLDGRFSRLLYAVFLALVAAGLALLWLAEIVPATLAGTTPAVVQELGPQAVHTYVLDLGILVPSLAITAWLLVRGSAWGDVFAGVLLVMASLLAPTLIALTVADVQADQLTLTTPLIVGTVLPPTVAVAFAARYVLTLDGRASAGDPVETGRGDR